MVHVVRTPAETVAHNLHGSGLYHTHQQKHWHTTFMAVDCITHEFSCCLELWTKAGVECCTCTVKLNTLVPEHVRTHSPAAAHNYIKGWNQVPQPRPLPVAWCFWVACSLHAFVLLLAPKHALSLT